MIGFICIMHKSKLRPNGFELINNFIKTLYEFCKKDFILYLFDNESDEKYDVPNYSNIIYEYIENQYLRGLVGPYNDGVKKAIKDNCDIIIPTNDDVVFNDTINIFIDTIENHEHKYISLYGPLTNGVIKNSSYQEAQKPGIGIREITNLNGIKKSFTILNGFLWGFTKEIYEKFKLPDENLFATRYKWGGGERNFHNRVKSLGGRVFIINECWVFHHKIRGWKKIK